MSCATPREREAVVGEHMLVVLDVLAELRLRDARRTTARSARARASRQLVGRAGVAMRERDVARAPGLDRERQGRRSRAVIGSRLVGLGVEADELRALDRAQPALERGVVEHGFVVEVGAACPRRSTCALRIVEAAAGLLARRIRRDRAGSILARRDPCDRGATALNSKRSYSAFSVGVSGAREREVGRPDGSSQSVFTVSSRLPCGSQSSVARRFSPTTPPISPACAMTASSVPYCVEPLRGGLRTDLRHARHVVDRRR